MPTPKQVRYHYARVSALRWKLGQALNDAYNADVISYTDHETQSPCKMLGECWSRFKQTTNSALADAMREEIDNDRIARKKKRGLT